MSGNVAPLRPDRPDPAVDAAAVLSALAPVVLVLDAGGSVRYANSAAEQLFDASAPHLCGRPLTDLVPADSPMQALPAQARSSRGTVSEYGVVLDTPRTGQRLLTVQASPLPEEEGWVVLALHEQSMAAKMGAQLSHRSAARSVTAMAAMLAHEVKNPLSGIRGAAQLLEQGAAEEDRALTRLICEEADRIVALVNRMEVFSDGRPLERGAVNIHEVLEQVRRVAQAGFGRHVRFVEAYDPSLPEVFGNRDQLVQVFLNLVKNAVEAVPPERGEVVLATAYQHGVRLAVPGTDSVVHLPLVVSVQDNGPGIPEDMRPHLFDPFVTGKAAGSGLGLALVAKIIGEHGGVVEFESQPPRGTVFRVMLPTAPEGTGRAV